MCVHKTDGSTTTTDALPHQAPRSRNCLRLKSQFVPRLKLQILKTQEILMFA